MKGTHKLIMDVTAARQWLVTAVEGLTADQAAFQPAPEAWSVWLGAY